MGVDPYLIAPTLILAIAQRLVKLLCPGGGKPVPVDGSIKLLIDKEFEDVPLEFKKDIKIPAEVYEAAPTPECPKGTSGRMAVVEVLQMSKDLEKIILEGPSDTKIMKVARLQGMLTLKEDAMIKAFDKLIPFEEVSRV
jgi:type II secretory ATPase GspE/PulE/Tfp pilus assembly ATPase PilB-like protein